MTHASAPPPPETTGGETPSPLRIREFRNLLPISITVALGFGIVIPVLPAFARSFGVGLALVGLVQFVFGLTRFSFATPAGLMVDRFGQRAVTVTGILIVAVSSYAVGLAGNFVQLVLARGFGGAGSALFITGLMNRVLEVVPPQSMGRATGVWRSSFLVGIGVGPALGGILGDRLGNRAPFHIYATGLLLAAAIAWVALGGGAKGSASQRRSPIEALKAARPLFSDLRYVVALLATLVGWWTISGPAQQIGVLFATEQLHFSATRIGVAVTLLSAGEVLILLLAGRAADVYGRRAVLVPALAVTAAATAALGQVEPVPWAFFPVMVAIGVGVAAGGVAAGGLLADAIPQGGSGTAVGVNQMAGDLGFMISPAAVGAVAEAAGFRTAYVVGAVPAALAFLIALRLPSQAPARRKEEGRVEPVEPVG